MNPAARFPGFRDLDDGTVYHECESALIQASTENFVIQFDQDTATSAFNLDGASMKSFLDAGWNSNESTRWINIWGPERQESLMKALSNRYQFAPRLLGIMLSKHIPRPSTRNSHEERANKHSPFPKVEARDVDSEKNMNGSATTSANPMDPTANMNHWNVVKEVWHFYSIDWNSKCKTVLAI